MVTITEFKRDKKDELLTLINRLFPNSSVEIKSNDTIFTAERKGKIIGFIHFSKNNRVVLLNGLGVDEKARKLGIGSKLIEHALSKFGNRTIYLKTKPDNPAVNLYSKYGFTLKCFSEDSYVLVRNVNF